ncbi:MAG: VWA domain-containing protein [Acidobacteriota bacterium]|nr:VWA domain-containing protein [Acidobacteriota bacterium]
MPRDIIKVGKQGVRIGDRVVTVKKKGIVYLLIDLSDSMNMFVGTKEELSLLKGTRQVSPDGFTGIRVDNSEHTSRLKTKLDVAMAGMKGFVDRALATKMVGIILFGSSAVLHHTASYDQAALRQAIASVEHHPLRGGGTNLSDALQILTKIEGTETAVVVTDGKPNNTTRALELGKVLKEKGTDILVIGTEDADWLFLSSLRSRPDLSVRTSNEGLGKAITDACRLLN